MSKGQRQTTLMDYDGFVEKFRSKKTTDDCFTPPEIYEVVKNWACERFDIDPESIVRPFYPDLDYVSYDYPDGCCVLDNPPFSKLAAICEFYLDNNIKFFLFAPQQGNINKTCWNKVCGIFVDTSIRYENGAEVLTSFVTNLNKDFVAITAPDLMEQIDKVQHKTKYSAYDYPENIVTGVYLKTYARHNVILEIPRDECVQILQLDAQKPLNKTIHGGGLLVSSRIAAQVARAREIVRKDQEARVVHLQLSDRERKIIQMLDEGRTGLHDTGKS